MYTPMTGKIFFVKQQNNMIITQNIQQKILFTDIKICHCIIYLYSDKKQNIKQNYS